MTPPTARVDPYLFQRHFAAFQVFVEEKSGIPFVSFAANPYTEKQEGYKYEIHRAARNALAFQAWGASDIGTGEIATAVIEAIEIPNSNLVPWQPRFGKEARPHQPLIRARDLRERLSEMESALYKLYRCADDEASFAELVQCFGKSYPLIAYLYFLKDRSKYLPIAPTFFDASFALLGVDFRTSHRCSWNNYTLFIAQISEVKELIAETLGGEVSLLDAHSFVWMLAAQMKKENRLANVQEYLELPPKEREAIVKARIGQGQFRRALIEYWGTCAVTQCEDANLLRASHIKPWAKSSLTECRNLHNGLLLSPNLDRCFDAGYISFDDEGQILISGLLSAVNAAALGIHPEMRLKRLEPEHRPYLAFHRENEFNCGRATVAGWDEFGTSSS